MQVFISLRWDKYAKRVWQQNTFNGLLQKKIKIRHHVIFEMAHTIAPVLEINIAFYAMAVGKDNIHPTSLKC